MELVQDDNDKKVFPKEPCDKNLLLNSIKSFQPEGVECGVDKMVTPRKNNFGKVTLNAVLRIIGDMPKCRLYDLDENGQYIEVEDEMTGESRRKIIVGDGNMKTVFFPFYANIKKGEEGLDENTTLIILPKTSSYSFFREAFVENGDIPSNAPEQAIATCFKEIEEVLTGFTFIAKYELIKGKNRAFPALKVEQIDGGF